MRNQKSHGIATNVMPAKRYHDRYNSESGRNMYMQRKIPPPMVHPKKKQEMTYILTSSFLSPIEEEDISLYIYIYIRWWYWGRSITMYQPINIYNNNKISVSVSSSLVLCCFVGGFFRSSMWFVENQILDSFNQGTHRSVEIGR